MVEEETVPAIPPSQQFAAHERDYSLFRKLFKWGAIVCFIVGLVWVFIVKTYW